MVSCHSSSEASRTALPGCYPWLGVCSYRILRWISPQDTSDRTISLAGSPNWKPRINRRLRDLLGLDREARAAPVAGWEPTLFLESNRQVAADVTRRSSPEEKVRLFSTGRGLSPLVLKGGMGSRKPDTRSSSSSPSPD